MTAVLSSVPSWAEAQTLRGHRRPYDRGIEARLDLTPDQAREIRRLRRDHRKEQIQRRAALQVARLELAELLAAPQLDEGAIRAKARAIGDQQALDVRARLEHRLAVAKVLTAEQRERAQEMRAWRHGRRGFHRGAARHGGRRGSGWRGWSERTYEAADTGDGRVDGRSELE
jgi:Spy/CpxP family protein refolding chaperone